MGETSKIAWTEATWNPMTGCDNQFTCWKRCYARAIVSRFNAKDTKPFAPRFYPNRLDIPMKWREGKLIFVCSLGDLFSMGMDLDATVKIFQVMVQTQQHKYLLLTKRPDRMRAFLHYIHNKPELRLPLPFKNVFFGVSVCQQADLYRVPILLSCYGFMHFLSVEPLLGPLDLSPYLDRTRNSFIDWVIVGGESGPQARPMHPEWVKDLHRQCWQNNTPFFFKQWGAWKPIEQPLFDAPHQSYCVQGALDDCYTKCTLKEYSEHPYIDSVQLFQKVGKKRAGELFCGDRLIQEYPPQL